jgi:hypothetical protein
MVIKTPVHYSTDETVPICGVKSKAVSHYLGEVSCLKCVLILRNIGLAVPVKRRGKR